MAQSLWDLINGAQASAWKRCAAGRAQAEPEAVNRDTELRNALTKRITQFLL